MAVEDLLKKKYEYLHPKEEEYVTHFDSSKIKMLTEEEKQEHLKELHEKWEALANAPIGTYIPKATIEKMPKKTSNERPFRHRRAIQCVETGLVFEQESYAKDWLLTVTGKCGCPSQAARHGCTARGYHWKYVDLY